MLKGVNVEGKFKKFKTVATDLPALKAYTK